MICLHCSGGRLSAFGKLVLGAVVYKAKDLRAEKEARLKAWRQMHKKLQLRWKKVALLVNFAD